MLIKPDEHIAAVASPDRQTSKAWEPEVSGDDLDSAAIMNALRDVIESQLGDNLVDLGMGKRLEHGSASAITAPPLARTGGGSAARCWPFGFVRSCSTSAELRPEAVRMDIDTDSGACRESAKLWRAPLARLGVVTTLRALGPWLARVGQPLPAGGHG